MLTRLLSIILLISPAAGCVDDTADERRLTARYDTLSSSGRIQVTNTSAGAWNAGTEWRLQEDLRLGTAGGGGPEQFARIGALLCDSLGMIYVLELAAQEIRVFHPTGAFSHTIGGRGAGPGEFELAMGMTFGPGDTLWVTDIVNQRYSAFARDGTFLRSVRRNVQQYGGRGEFVTGGRYVDWGLGFPEEGPGVIAGSRILHQPVRLSADFEHQDSLPPLEYTPEMMADGTLPQPFFNGALTIFLDKRGSIWFAHTRDYTIYRRSLAGDTSLAFTLRAEPARVGQMEHAYVRQMTARRPELAAAYLEALPEFKPILTAIVTDNSGHVFVFPETAETPGGTVVDVFRASGEFLGRIALPSPVPAVPPSALVAYATTEHLFLVVTDESDVPYVSRLVIVKPSKLASDGV